MKICLSNVCIILKQTGHHNFFDMHIHIMLQYNVDQQLNYSRCSCCILNYCFDKSLLSLQVAKYELQLKSTLAPAKGGVMTSIKTVVYITRNYTNVIILSSVTSSVVLHHLAHSQYFMASRTKSIRKFSDESLVWGGWLYHNPKKRSEKTEKKSEKRRFNKVSDT